MRIELLLGCLSCLMLCQSCKSFDHVSKDTDKDQFINKEIRFLPIIGKGSLILGQAYSQHDIDYQIETLKFYISEFHFINNGEIVYVEPKSYHLINAESDSLMFFDIRINRGLKYDAIAYTLGIDSLANTSPTFMGDLDPLKGMYWTWQSGYINFKLEGSYKALNSNAHRFEYHLGGYSGANACYKNINLSTKSSGDIHINMDLSKFIESVILEEQKNVMSPGKEAKKLFEFASKIFSI